MVTAIEALVLDVSDEVAVGAAREANCRGANCEDDAVRVCSIAAGMEFEDIVVPAATGLSNVGVSLPLSLVTLLAAHCPGYSQYYQVAQQIDPHDASPNAPSQVVGVAAAVAKFEVAGAGTETGEDD